MPKSKLDKEQDLKELTEKLQNAKAVVLSEYRGTTVKDISRFRKELKKENVFSKVYKITLLNKALASLGITETVDYKTPVIISISSEDETTPARLIKNFSKDLKTIGILQGVMDKKLISKDQVLVLADLPTRQQLLGKLVGTINNPVSGFVNVLAGNIRGLMNVLNAISQKA